MSRRKPRSRKQPPQRRGSQRSSRLSQALATVGTLLIFCGGIIVLPALVSAALPWRLNVISSPGLLCAGGLLVSGILIHVLSAVMDPNCDSGLDVRERRFGMFLASCIAFAIAWPFVWYALRSTVLPDELFPAWWDPPRRVRVAGTRSGVNPDITVAFAGVPIALFIASIRAFFLRKGQ